MKTIKIRFVEELESVYSPVIVYYIDEKTFFGWKRCVNMSSSNKEAILNDFIESNYPNYRKKRISLVEYPSIKLYNLVSDEL